ncbi:MAG: hypothetical protein R3E12_18930 [Candidatus Eisenbacteria bacterium]
MPVGAELVVDGSLVYFTSFDGDTGFEVAVYDGVEVHQLDVNPGPTGCTPSDLVVTDNGKAFFVGRDEASGNFGLYRITSPPSVAVGLVHDCGNDRPEQLTVLGGSVIFVNTDPDHGTELWTSNGTTTQLLADINPGTAGSNPQSLVRMGEHVFSRPRGRTRGASSGPRTVRDSVRISSGRSTSGRLHPPSTNSPTRIRCSTSGLPRHRPAPSSTAPRMRGSNRSARSFRGRGPAIPAISPTSRVGSSSARTTARGSDASCGWPTSWTSIWSSI